MRDNPEKIDYTAPRGISSIVEYFFNRAGNVKMFISQYESSTIDLIENFSFSRRNESIETYYTYQSECREK